MDRIETVMTYEDWEREYFRRSQKAKEKIAYYLMQKILGAILVIISLIGAYAIGDGTHCVILVPLGLYLALTRERVIYDFRN